MPQLIRKEGKGDRYILPERPAGCFAQNVPVPFPRPFSRRGLSTLEMVLCLPILLMVMAVILNYGTVACWKVRTLTMARHALWANRWPRSTSGEPRPEYWPQTAHSGSNAADDAPMLDDPRANHPVVRGPLPFGATVRSELLDPSRGLRQGSAEITREFPLLAKMGEYHLETKTCLLDNKWQYQRMDMEHNYQRRIPVIYSLAKAPPNLVDAYVQAVMAVFNAPFREDLRPLDRDDEFIYYRSRFGWGGGAPDFHPRLSRFCSLDPELAAERVESLIDRIQGKDVKDAEGNTIQHIPCVAETMTRRFISLYERVINELESLIQSSPPGQAAGMQAEIGQLQSKIDVLNQFLETLEAGS